ncbi:MAG: alpha/beta hydrolase [Bacteroidales bacterium]|nr:alpha/beta hydrolase [Bacteroidales bacterium]
MEKTINIRGTQLFYTVEGEGMPVILMHGWGCNHSTLKSIEAQLTPGFKVYNVDFPGFGGSNEPSAVWGVEEYTSLIEEFARQEHIESPILLGHSFGGRVGILFASRNKVHKLILVDAAGVKPRRSLRYYYKVYSYKAIKHALLFFLGKKRGETALNSYRAKVGSSDYSNASPMMRAILSKVVNEDLKSVMPKIACPTLLIWGANDTATPLADAKIMEKLIPDAGLVSFDGVGHYSFLENPYQFAAVLKSFLSKDMTKQ